MPAICTGTSLPELLADLQAPAFIGLIAVSAVMLLAILAVSWRDSKRAMWEFVAPLQPKRFQFRLRTLFLITTFFSVLLKVALWLDFWPNGRGVNMLTLLALAGILVGMLGFLICSFAETFRLRPRVNHGAPIPDGDDDAERPVEKIPKNKSIRFPQDRRQTPPFKW